MSLATYLNSILDGLEAIKQSSTLSTGELKEVDFCWTRASKPEDCIAKIVEMRQTQAGAQ